MDRVLFWGSLGGLIDRFQAPSYYVEFFLPKNDDDSFVQPEKATRNTEQHE